MQNLRVSPSGADNMGWHVAGVCRGTARPKPTLADGANRIRAISFRARLRWIRNYGRMDERGKQTRKCRHFRNLERFDSIAIKVSKGCVVKIQNNGYLR